jgi:hypothetical protein
MASRGDPLSGGERGIQAFLLDRPLRRMGKILRWRQSSPHSRRCEAAWTYPYPAGIGDAHQCRQTELPQDVPAIAWKAPVRLCARYRRLMAKGNQKTVATTAIACELAAFMWHIAGHVDPTAIAVSSRVSPSAKSASVRICRARPGIGPP